MNTGNKGELPRRIGLAIFMLIFLFNISSVHAEDLKEKIPPKTGVKTTVEERIDGIKETEKWKQRQAEEKRKQRIREKRKRAKMAYERHWKSIGECRITEYCPSCNDPAGTYQSSSGAYLYEGCVACNWLPNGTKIRIRKRYVFVVMDTCGTEAIDIFRDTSYCCCNGNYYAEVEIWR